MPAVIDIEKALVMEHVVTYIAGTTCTGCERKLYRVLSNIAGVHNIKTSLVPGRAEFDVDAGLSVNEVALLVERRTEFKCTIKQEGHQLEVLIPDSAPFQEKRLGTAAKASDKEFALRLLGITGSEYPSGVENIQIINSEGREWKSEATKSGLKKRLDVQRLASKPCNHIARITYTYCRSQRSSRERIWYSTVTGPFQY